MNKQEYVEYLNDELKKARDISNQIASNFKDENDVEDWIRKSPFETILSFIQSGLNYLSCTNLEGAEEFFSNYKSELNVIDAYSLENELEAIKNTYWKIDKKVYDFWGLSSQIIRAILAIQYTEMGVKVICQKHDDDHGDQYIFSLDTATKQDIWLAAFNYIEFTCPLTNTEYNFYSYEDRNEVKLLKARKEGA